MSAESFTGYHQTARGEPDYELAQTGAGTPCGEFLRRYWQPIFLADELDDTPKLIRILGEELVLFRDGEKRLGLVHKHCPHRRASLEFGRPEARGIRCCYHGWLFAVDGAILENSGRAGRLGSREKSDGDDATWCVSGARI